MSWNPDVDPTNRLIPPVGLPLGVIAASSVCLALSIVFAIVRVHARVVDHLFGIDDWLMVAGCLTYIPAIGVGIAAELFGIGTLDDELNQWQFEHSKKIHTAWLCAYVIPMCLVKASICVTLLRIVEARKNLRYVVFVLLAIVALAFVATFVGTLLQCQPIEAEWKPQLVTEGKATCAPIVIFVSLGYIATVAVIIIDASLVAIPAMVLWDSHMQLQQKLQIITMLSVGSVASIITMVRIPYVQRYSNVEDQHYWIAMIVLCSHIETGISIIAPCLPQLRSIVVRWRGRNQHGHTPDTDDIVTFGRLPRRTVFSRRARQLPEKGFSLTSVHAASSPGRASTGGGGSDSDEGTLLEQPLDAGTRTERTLS